MTSEEFVRFMYEGRQIKKLVGDDGLRLWFRDKAQEAVARGDLEGGMRIRHIEAIYFRESADGRETNILSIVGRLLDDFAQLKVACLRLVELNHRA